GGLPGRRHLPQHRPQHRAQRGGAGMTAPADSGVDTTSITRAEYCAIACAEAFRGDGEILVSPMALLPSLGARLARETFEPDLLLSDGEASFVAGPWPLGGRPPSVVEAWVP